MSNTIVTGGVYDQYVEISAMDGDYDAGKDRPLSSIQFNPGPPESSGDGADVLIVRHGSAAGPIVFKATADSGNNAVCKYFDGLKIRPYIDLSECSLSAGFEIIIIYKED